MHRDKKCSFVLYHDYLDHVCILSDTEAGRLFKAILMYARDGNLNLNQMEPSTLMAFGFIRAQMDRDAAKWVETCERRRTSGRAGGLAKARAMQQNQTILANATTASQTVANVAEDGTARVTETAADDVYGVDTLAREYGLPPPLINKAKEWISYKQEKGEIFTSSTIRQILKQLMHHYTIHGDNAVAELIDLCIARGWNGIIFDRLSNNQSIERSSQHGESSENHPVKRTGNYI